MDRKLTIILSITTIVALGVAAWLQWSKDGSWNIGVLLLMPIVLLSLFMNLRKKS